MVEIRKPFQIYEKPTTKITWNSQQQQNPSAEYVKEDSRKSLYKKIFPNVNSFKNKVYPSKLFSADHVKVNENGPIIGNLDKFHTVNIYSNTYKETTKR